MTKTSGWMMVVVRKMRVASTASTHLETLNGGTINELHVILGCVTTECGDQTIFCKIKLSNYFIDF